MNMLASETVTPQNQNCELLQNGLNDFDYMSVFMESISVNETGCTVIPFFLIDKCKSKFSQKWLKELNCICIQPPVNMNILAP
jgi:hypothetical protein